MKEFLKKVLIGQIKRNQKKVQITDKSLERQFKALVRTESATKTEIIHHTIGFVVAFLIVMSFMFLGAYVLVAIYNAMGMWYVLGSIFAFAFVKEGFYFIKQMID